jgi:TPR repeat protein
MYWRGEGVAVDVQKAREWFERGEQLDNGMSLNGLGLMHKEGVAGFEKVFCILFFIMELLFNVLHDFMDL